MRRRGLSRRDLLAEALSAIAARPGRAVLTSMGTVLGVGSLVATLALTTTARAQVSEEFDAVAATEVRVEAPPPPDASGPMELPADAERRVRRVDGVAAAGLLWAVDTDGHGLRARWPSGDRAGEADGLPLFAASPGALDAIDLDVAAGRTYDAGHERRSDPVILLSRAAANQLGIADVDRQPVVFVGDRALVVIGLFDHAARRAEVVAGALVPMSTARALWGTATTGAHEVVVHTRPGAAQVVAAQLAVALRPDRPELLSVTAPPDPRLLRRHVDAQIATLFLVLAAVSIGAGAFSIANTTLVSVLERVPEIGLRRAVGARRSDIARQFLVESAVLGTAGGVVGAVLGLVAAAVICLVRSWTATVEPWALLPTPLLGTGTGLLAGLYPAIQAARIDPVVALRRA